jgi:diguanylate cyclase
MSNASLFTRRSYGALLSRLVWPTAALLVATLGIVFATVIWMSGSANEAAGERQRVQIAAAFEQRLEDMRIRLADASARSGALARPRRKPPTRAAPRLFSTSTAC